ncbi:LysR family transcriptional regulator [Kluyvera intermedia]|jgi:DNA-binding transcriptional LysR family regulator|uniref:LysR family transcriptional regulator n=1 Tax=Kluyvera intermedia TaxID=61648 RepID=A0A3S4GKG7_KLUIN|nr:LysR family transcriptional regulator [Kluyvera intermedia]QGH31219.1 LysR family transcriptional regulator [Kluyvera intermedia]QGH40201.1 LysR family transcriptional regulator [Kluyvera intermedia]WEJ82544.1 MAG: LysR family transcriptional regulator [Kluyvera intermedia]WGL55355.1 LysR family transcriptional regulator [Kluyvera intermedia]WQD28816.1 LysR family transcriptional regulator [Kluyvera intermedia]
MRINLDVLLILDALDKHGSFAAAAESLFKTSAALSYMIQKLENDLGITLLDRSGHRAKFTDTGRMMLEKGRLLLDAAKDLEKQALQLSAGWEKELAIALDDSFPFAALVPIIKDFYALHKQTRLNFSHHTLAGSWEELTHNGADIILGAINEPPTSAAWSYKMLGTMDNVFVVAPDHPLASASEDLTNEQLCLHRAIVISDSARFCHPLKSNLMDEQPQTRVDDFHSKVTLLRAGVGCGFLPRHIASPLLATGELVEKSVISFRQTDVAYMAWRNGHDGLAQRWWRETLLTSTAITGLYQ